MIIRDKEVGGTCVLELYGQLSGEGASSGLRQAVREYLQRGCERFVVNLRGLDAIDSSGIGELVACHWRIHRDGKSMHVLTKDPGMVFEILMKVRLDQIFSILEDERDIAKLD